eukprot:CAMPEP_0171268028 /NCGR_PEP_ID=MMETSP0790-20130122/59458_1 /TAXON_ID=2925 /ORGANISM="Alexandrium catenella, Strain OF101" /LENGTH=44 /DNA_ID= /DNA_START= /DNA_END= /DNA_ORIENTATION=
MVLPIASRFLAFRGRNNKVRDRWSRTGTFSRDAITDLWRERQKR